MSSSSSAEPCTGATIAAQLADAFALLERNVPSAYREIARHLGERRVRIRVDDELFVVAGENAALLLSDPGDEAAISIDTSRAVVRDVLAGRTTLATALRHDTLRARGTLRDLVAVLASLEAFVHGAIRCEGIVALFEEFSTERVA